MNEPKKRPLLNFFKRVIPPLFRATVKSIPYGGFILEVAQNIKHSRDPEKAGGKHPHDPLSLLAQAVLLGMIVYAFATHAVTIDEVINLIGGAADLFSSTIPVPSTDTIPHP